jgi:hypothetical protein
VIIFVENMERTFEMVKEAEENIKEAEVEEIIKEAKDSALTTEVLQDRVLDFVGRDLSEGIDVEDLKDVKKRRLMLRSIVKGAIREKGSIDDFRDILLQFGVIFLQSDSEKVRFDCWRELMGYVYPKRSASAVAFDANIEIKFNF